MVFETKKFDFPLPSLGELEHAKRMLTVDPEELDDRDIWILNEFVGDSK